MADEHGDVHGRWRGAPPGEIVANRERRAAVLADDERRDALRDLGKRIGLDIKTVGRMIVRVDHAGREHQAGGIDDAVLRPRRDRADFDDGVAGEADVDAPRRRRCHRRFGRHESSRCASR